MEKCHEIASDSGSGCAGQFRNRGQNIVKMPRTAVTGICSWYQADQEPNAVIEESRIISVFQRSAANGEDCCDNY
jgi:hypothetical protein